MNNRRIEQIALLQVSDECGARLISLRAALRQLGDNCAVEISGLVDIEYLHKVGPRGVSSWTLTRAGIEAQLYKVDVEFKN